MKPQTQGLLHSETQMGDCWRTCIACILEVDRDTVPNFVELGGPENAPGTDEGAWWEATLDFLEPFGLQLIEWEIDAEHPWAPMSATILTGKSPRNSLSHSVVGFGLEIVHDPHPTRAGLDGPPKRVAVFIAIDPARHR